MSPVWPCRGFAIAVAQVLTDTEPGDALAASAAALRERLDRAANDSLSTTVARWFRFLDVRDGEVVELQALQVPIRSGYERNEYGHVASVDDAVRALRQAEEKRPKGIYYVLNEVDPVVATRATPDRWHPSRKNESTTDRDIIARRALFIDVDAERSSGTSASEEELQRAFGKAAEVLAWLREHLPEGAIGVGHSGNGVSLFLAIERLAETPELARLARALLAGLAHRFSDGGAKVDTTVHEAKRLMTTSSARSPSLVATYRHVARTC